MVLFKSVRCHVTLNMLLYSKWYCKFNHVTLNFALELSQIYSSKIEVYITFAYYTKEIPIGSPSISDENIWDCSKA